MVAVHIGYAADPQGNGVAYARLRSLNGERLVRAAFRVRRFPGLEGREVAYGALTAVAAMLADRKISNARFYIADADLVADRAARRAVPPPLVLSYVALGCALNRLSKYDVEIGTDPDLTARARAEVVLNHVA
jgi:hypothetical protein